MISGSRPFLAIGLPVLALSAAPALAEATGGTSPSLERVTVDIVRDLETSPQPRSRLHGADLDWGTGALRLDAAHIREGRKHGVAAGTEELWRRGAMVLAQLEFDLAPGWRTGVGGRGTYLKQGAIGGPLFVGKTTRRSAEADLSLASEGGARFTLSAFDNGGWNPGSIEEFARTIASGVARQKAGFALKIGSTPAAYASAVSLSLRAESSYTRGLGRERSLALATNFRF